MSRALVTIAALVLSCSFVWGEGAPLAPAAVKPLADSYERCVVDRAKSFAGSADSAEAIVREAIRACAPQKGALSEALRPAGLNPDASASFLSKLDEQVSQTALQAVLEERAAH
jgi:hypothetical protein